MKNTGYYAGNIKMFFTVDDFSVQEKTDKIIAQELQEKEKDLVKHKEKKEFQKLQVQKHTCLFIPPHR